MVGKALSVAPGGDVKVKVTVKFPNNSTKTSSDYAITVRGPYKLVPGSKLHSPLDGYGYASQIWYTIRDNFSATMPSTTAFGEQWTTAVDNRYTGTNWQRPDPHGDSISNSTFYDSITGPGLNNQPAPYTPLRQYRRAGVRRFNARGRSGGLGALYPARAHGCRPTLGTDIPITVTMTPSPRQLRNEGAFQ